MICFSMTLENQRRLLRCRIATAYLTYIGLASPVVLIWAAEDYAMAGFCIGALAWAVNWMMGPYVKTHAAEVIRQRQLSRMNAALR